MQLMKGVSHAANVGAWFIVSIETERRNQLVDITQLLEGVVRQSGVRRGTCHLFLPHADAAILSTIKKSDTADSLEQVELILEIEEAFDRGQAVDLREQAAVSDTLAIEDGRIILKHGFGVRVCEYSGPRVLELMVKIEED